MVIGTEGRDVIAALEGNNVIRGLGGDDLICGDEGNDNMVGGALMRTACLAATVMTTSTALTV